MYGAAKKRDTHRVREWGSKRRKREARFSRRQEDAMSCARELEAWPRQDYEDLLCTCASCSTEGAASDARQIPEGAARLPVDKPVDTCE